MTHPPAQPGGAADLRLSHRVREGIAALHPAYFALVMATGIVSIAGYLHGWTSIGLCLFGLNVVFYAMLIALVVIRLVGFAPRIMSDLFDHGRCVGFFTTVAGTCVLGSQFLVIGKAKTIAIALWILGVCLWVLINYGVFTVLTIKSNKPQLAQGINGGWLVAVVATQSVSVLASQLAVQGELANTILPFVALSFWLGGGMLYIWIISLIFYRYTFLVLEPSDLAPPYWINMGAMAISTLAGTALIATASQSNLLQELLPFLKGFTLFFWATATWWIPMLAILGCWRHVYRRFPLRYDPLYWGAVFPLGMYATCTLRLSDVLGLPFLTGLASIFFWVGLAAWTAAFLGLLNRLWRMGLRRS